MTDELLVKAAIFLATDGGSEGFLDRFTAAVNGDARLVSRALEAAMAAQSLAGHASIQIEPGGLRVLTTSSGASLTACAVPGPDGSVRATVRLVDASRRPVEGAALQVSTQGHDQMIVTNTAGWIHVGDAGPSISISVGQASATGAAYGAAGVIALPRPRGRDEFALAAAHDSGTPEAEHPGSWRLEAGGVEFMCLERKGGYDLTMLVADVTGDFARSAIGTHAVSFRTQDRARRPRSWIVPLAPSPLGLAGSLYGTDEGYLDADSVTVRGTEQLIATFGDQLEEVIRRSVWHSDTADAWAAVSRRLAQGRSLSVLTAALAQRENSL